MKVNSLIFTSISKHPVTLQGRKMTLYASLIYLKHWVTDPSQPFEDPNVTFIWSMTFHSADSHHKFNMISKQITDLKKEGNKREQQKKEMVDDTSIKQDILVEIKGRRSHKLLTEGFNVLVVDRRWFPGEVEIHQNGLWFMNAFI